ncbi:globin-coupled sensor protein [Sphingomonas glaciei]|uniref:Globin-coupled sensor protein n=1 Tax=Sphingomonas glaciei TaxID=2938948 RepID=A0ABY5MTE5_9SPHN|nr:globin-coupled sensor protein [Sphingomonas glaciei]UUR07448.1 globin-coupled sensor protein [Sphingomonas glaciei]
MSDDIQSRLQFMNFTQGQRDLLSGMRHLLARLIPPALDTFYEKVKQTPNTRRFFRDGEHMRCAHAAQRKHWARIAEGRFDGEFVSSVQRIGAVHAAIGLEPQWYIGAYSLVLEQLLTGIGREYGFWQRARNLFRGPRQGEVSAALVKAALLDMELSVSIYFAQSQVERTAAIASLSAALNTVAKGDLTADLGEMPASFAAIKRDYDEAIARLRELVSGVADGAVHIQTGSSEIAQAAEDLARRTESTAATLEQTAAAVSQMDERIRATSSAAERSVRQADDTSATVANGRQVARQAVAAMEAVSASATGIDGVIEGLDKIAFQTRVLAMNAAVEAGRAGEAGRGFAVVADLVSALAMRAEEEAKKARTELTTTQTGIVSAVGAVTQVDGELQRISETVEAVHQLVSDIARDNQAQATAITEINSAVSSMDRATQQNAAMVEQTSAAARNLAGEVARLNDKTGQFTTGAPRATSRSPSRATRT